MNYLQYPSYHAHIISVALMVIAIFILYMNYSAIKKMEPYYWIVLLLLFSLVTAMHGLSHLGLEYVYNYNPITQILSLL